MTITATRSGWNDGSATSPSISSLNAALTPTFGTSTSTVGGFTVQVSNYSASYTWGVSSSAGAASINGSGLVTVTGLAPGGSATVTVTTTRTGYVGGSATSGLYYALNSQVSLVVSNSPLTGVAGTPIVLTTSGGSGGGVVTFVVTTPGAGCVVVAGVLTATGAGSCGVTATKAVSGIYASTTSGPVPFTFSSTTLTAQATLRISHRSLRGVVGTPIILATTGGSGTGAVTYQVTGAKCTLSGASLAATGATNCSVAATKAASGIYASTTSAAVTFRFLSVPRAPLVIISSTLVAPHGTRIALTTSGGGGDGDVTFAVSGSEACSIVRRGSTTYVTASSAAKCNVTATKEESETYAASRSPVVTFRFT